MFGVKCFQLAHRIIFESITIGCDNNHGNNNIAATEAASTADYSDERPYAHAGSITRILLRDLRAVKSIVTRPLDHALSSIGLSLNKLNSDPNRVLASNGSVAT